MRLRFRPSPPGPGPSDLDPPVVAPPAAWRDDADLVTERVEMWHFAPSGWPDTGTRGADEERLRPLYARVLGLRHVEPGAVLCFVFFEGTVVLGFLLALAELVSWWGVLMLPASVALMVKINDVVAAAVARSAARVPEIEQERFRRELQPAIGRAVVTEPRLAPPTAQNCRSTYPEGPVGNGGSAVTRVRPELATPRTRPRPMPAPEISDDGPAEDRAAEGQTCDDALTTASGPGEPKTVRRARNAHPAGRNDHPTDRRVPAYLPDRRNPGTSAEQWIRQSARQRYDVTDRQG